MMSDAKQFAPYPQPIFNQLPSGGVLSTTHSDSSQFLAGVGASFQASSSSISFASVSRNDDSSIINNTSQFDHSSYDHSGEAGQSKKLNRRGLKEELKVTKNHKNIDSEIQEKSSSKKNSSFNVISSKTSNFLPDEEGQVQPNESTLDHI